ncbi:tumor necrosis factor receptor superfamily member 5 isoform X2 [Gopherus evgoodei]|uniref:tumor necrosis factor receptor superfamily member 5 isoform X2 n=1 Tax=Gopherus evgoodei TaxID=1825980 RepID=UPI0011CF684B|nr:tumor necrosis factor receptor superfamily member 5 isoform X2 [Gopherus evgoodei]
MLPGCLLCLLGGCLLRHWASGSDFNCTAKQYQHDDRCCNRCEPGLKLLSDCTASQNSVCEPCEERHFQSGWTREKHCTPHKSCDHNAGLETRSRGDAKHNAECQCQQGMYCSSPDCQTCLNITACRPGEGVARKADNLSDTTCEPCKHGTFSSISSASEPCRPWTSKTPGAGPDPRHCSALPAHSSRPFSQQQLSSLCDMLPRCPHAGCFAALLAPGMNPALPLSAAASHWGWC